MAQSRWFVFRAVLISIASLAALDLGLASARAQDRGADLTQRLTDAIRTTIDSSRLQDEVGSQFGPEIYTRMLQGDVVPQLDQISKGLVFVNGGCSGVLLSNQWALTAGHCFAFGVPRTASVRLAGTTIQSSIVYGFGHEMISPGVTVQRGVDIALIRTFVPFSINDSTTGFSNEIFLSAEHELADRVTFIYGQGINFLGAGLFAASGAGVFRLGVLQITPDSTSPTQSLLVAKPIINPGSVCAWGDSGGPMFVVDRGKSRVASIVQNVGAICDTPPCNQNTTNEIRSCNGPKIYNYREAITDIIGTTWDPSRAFQLFDIGRAEWVGMGQISGSVDVNLQPWGAAARSANEMCFNRGFIGGHLNGHQFAGKFGLGCAGASGARWRDATNAEVAATPWPFNTVDTATWAQANRSAARLCEQGGFVGGHFNGFMAPVPSGSGMLFGLLCYSAPAKGFEAAASDLAGAWQVNDVNTVEWALAARAANDFCQRHSFSTGFMNGHQFEGRFGVICH